MKSLFKVTLLATTMAVALHAQSPSLLTLRNQPLLLTAKQHSRMTTKKPLTRWARPWVVIWKTL